MIWYAKPPGHRLGFRDMHYTLPPSPPPVKRLPTLVRGPLNDQTAGTVVLAPGAP